MADLRLSGYANFGRSAEYVQLEGLSELRKTLRRIDAGMGTTGRNSIAVRAFRDHLREAATIVAEEGKRRAPRQSGKLIKSIRPRVRGDVGLVVALAVRKSKKYPEGYRYPRRIEYEGSGGQRAGYGTRAYLGPALEAKADEVAEHMEGVLDAIANAWETDV